MTIRSARARAQVALAALAAMLVSGAAACGGDDVDLPEAPPPQTPVEESQAPTLTAEEQQAVDEVQALVDEFLTVYVEIVTAGEPGTDDVLARLPRGFPLIPVNNEIAYNYLEERRVEGQLQWEFAEVVDVDMDNVAEFRDGERIVPVVRLRYCVDSTNWQTVDKDTGEPVEPGEHRLLDPFGARYLATLRASYYDPSPVEPADNPYWQVNEWENEQDEPC